MGERLHLSLEQRVMNHNKIGMESLSFQQFDKSIKHLHKANLLLQNSPNAKLRAMTLNNLGCLYKRLKQYGKALAFLTEALQEQVDSMSTAATHLNLCAVRSIIGQHGEALAHAQRSLKMLKGETSTVNVTITAVVAYNNAATELEYLGELKEASSVYYEGWQYAVEHLGRAHELSLQMLQACKLVSHKKRKHEVKRDLPSRNFVSPPILSNKKATPSTPKMNTQKRFFKPVEFDHRIHFLGEKMDSLGKRMEDFEEKYFEKREDTPEQLTFFSKKRQAAARVLQGYWRQRITYKRMVRAAKRIQTFYRGSRSRALFHKLQYVVLISQTAIRRTNALKIVKKIKGCISIQLQFKMWIHRRKNRKILGCRKIQRYFRAFLGKKNKEIAFFKICVIQTFVRKKISYDFYKKFKTVSIKSATSIQLAFRMFHARQIAESYSNLCSQSSLTIQKVLRRKIGDIIYTRTKIERTKAKKLIEKWYRGWRARKSVTMYKQNLDSSCQTIQQKYNQFVCKLGVDLIRNYRIKMNRNSGIVQKKFRQVHMRIKYEEIKEYWRKMNAVSLMIQLKFKQFLQKQFLDKLILQNNMIKTIQRKFRVFLLRVSLFEHRKRFRVLNSRIKLYIKKHEEDNDMIIPYILSEDSSDEEMITSKALALPIQLKFKSFLAKHICFFEKNKKFARSIVKSYLNYRRSPTFRQKKDTESKAVIPIKAACSVWLANDYIKNKICRGNPYYILKSLIKIQAVFRCFLSNIEFNRTKFTHTSAAVLIQTTFRRHFYSKKYKQMLDASIQIQAKYRAYKARTQYKTQKLFLDKFSNSFMLGIGAKTDVLPNDKIVQSYRRSFYNKSAYLRSEVTENALEFSSYEQVNLTPISKFGHRKNYDLDSIDNDDISPIKKENPRLDRNDFLVSDDPNILRFDRTPVLPKKDDSIFDILGNLNSGVDRDREASQRSILRDSLKKIPEFEEPRPQMSEEHGISEPDKDEISVSARDLSPELNSEPISEPKVEPFPVLKDRIVPKSNNISELISKKISETSDTEFESTLLKKKEKIGKREIDKLRALRRVEKRETIRRKEFKRLEKERIDYENSKKREEEERKQETERQEILRRKQQKKQEKLRKITQAFESYLQKRRAESQLLEAKDENSINLTPVTKVHTFIQYAVAKIRCDFQKEAQIQKQNSGKLNVAKAMQAYFRGAKDRQKHQRIIVGLFSFQALLRHFIYRKLILRIKTGSRVVRVFKSLEAFKKCRTIYNARLIQTAFRSFLTNEEVSVYEMARVHAAATLIQAHARGFLTRLRYMQVVDASTYIQSAYRASRVRKMYLELRSVVMVIQVAWRDYLRRKRAVQYIHPVFTSKKQFR